MCKYLGPRDGGRVTDRALRMHGGHRLHARAQDRTALPGRARLWFEEGTSEIQRLVIADDVVATASTSDERQPQMARSSNRRDALSTIKVIDVDSHVAEPPDLWTSRVSKKFGDDIPISCMTSAGSGPMARRRSHAHGGRQLGDGRLARAPSTIPADDSGSRSGRVRTRRTARTHGRVRGLGPGAVPEPARLLQSRLHADDRPGAAVGVRARLQRLPDRLRRRRPRAFRAPRPRCRSGTSRRR